MIFVTVLNPRGREFYVNGVYDNPRGPTPQLVTLNTGAHVIEMLTPDGRRVEFEGFVNDVDDMGSVTIDLSPVVPPKRKGT
jgi:hypothetical protein